MEKIIAYYRVSTAKQKRSRLGLEAQKDMIKTFAEANECEILGEFEEVEFLSFGIQLFKHKRSKHSTCDWSNYIQE